MLAQQKFFKILSGIISEDILRGMTPVHVRLLSACYSSKLKMEAASCYETPLNYRTTRRQIL
jgi:hypothetical protein